MSRITFDQLLEIYRHTTFTSASGERGNLLVADQGILDTLLFIEDSERAFDEAGLTIEVERSRLEVGSQVPIIISAPRTALGRFARSLDHLLRGPRARVEEPNCYFVVEGKYDHRTVPVPSELEKYRGILRIITLLAEAAAFLDKDKQELVFIRKGRFSVPIVYSADQVREFNLNPTEEIFSLFMDGIHREQKLAILVESVAEITENLNESDRFSSILSNISVLLSKTSEGYKLFASSFSYEKIRGEIEAARTEYVNKIHKTFTDIQGQILGIPVATVIVATQIANANSCGKEFWGNTAVLIGAWIFVILLLAAIVNQWLTLGTIEDDVRRQQKNVREQHSSIEKNFEYMFSSIRMRLTWHRAILTSISVISVVGLVLAHVVYSALTQASPLTCFINVL